MARISYADAYPRIDFRPRTLNWWARLTRVPAECVHLQDSPNWMAALVPDTLYLRGRAAARRPDFRPEVCLCRDCLLDVAADELAAYRGRLLAFEPDPRSFSQYFFLSVPDFGEAGLRPEVAAVINQRLGEEGECAECDGRANWLWFSHAEVASLDDVTAIAGQPGEHYCALHGAQRFCRALRNIREANLMYMNLPYGDSNQGGAYIWI